MKATIKRIIALLILIMTAMTCLATEPNWDEVIVGRMMEDYALDEKSYEIELLSNPLKTEDAATCEISLRTLTQKAPLGLFSVLATVSRDGEVLETGQVRMRVKKYDSVVVVTDRCLRSDPFDSGRLEVQWMEVTKLREQPLKSIKETIGFRAKRNLRKGTILTTGAIQPIPDVETGMETLIVYDDGICRITAPGVALQSGVSGDYIKVKNKATRKIVVARVIEDGAVAIDP
jgi:flagella basal body P-ring formation protein FlgA